MTLRLMKALGSAAALLACALAANAEGFRTAQHLVTFDVQELSGESRLYEFDVREGESRVRVTSLQVVTTGREPARAAVTVGATDYLVTVLPFGKSALIEFTCSEAGETVETTRTGFTTEPKPQPRRRAPSLFAGRDVAVPDLVRRVEAVYTADARAAGAAGRVLLEVAISRSGLVRDLKVLVPMGHGLTEAALEAVQQWEFAPATFDGAPGEVTHEVAVDFEP